ncbi:hypothetical protein FCF25_06435 [Haloprofundus sp. MHR1]|nr:hypothetical protein FCF25_06435 [Haloprofundus sp. MHR1]
MAGVVAVVASVVAVVSFTAFVGVDARIAPVAVGSGRGVVAIVVVVRPLADRRPDSNALGVERERVVEPGRVDGVARRRYRRRLFRVRVRLRLYPLVGSGVVSVGGFGSVVSVGGFGSVVGVGGFGSVVSVGGVGGVVLVVGGAGGFDRFRRRGRRVGGRRAALRFSAAEHVDERFEDGAEFLPAGRTEHDRPLLVVGRVEPRRDDGEFGEAVAERPAEVTRVEVGHTPDARAGG